MATRQNSTQQSSRSGRSNSGFNSGSRGQGSKSSSSRKGSRSESKGLSLGGIRGKVGGFVNQDNLAMRIGQAVLVAGAGYLIWNQRGRIGQFLDSVGIKGLFGKQDEYGSDDVGYDSETTSDVGSSTMTDVSTNDAFTRAG